MSIKWLIAFSLLFASPHLFGKPYAEADFLDPRLSRGNVRYDTFKMALRLIKQRNLDTLVETGTSRFGKKGCEGDGGSTLIFSHFCAIYKKKFYSVDINQDYLDQAFRASVPFQRSVEFVCDDSIHFLSTFDGKIDFLYLDSFDYVYENPFPSQLHHLKEIQAAYDKLSPRAVVMIDDCNLPGGGKGLLVIEFLTARGWKILMSNYQVILSR